jgi:hypothetical protein
VVAGGVVVVSRVLVDDGTAARRCCFSGAERCFLLDFAEEDEMMMGSALVERDVRLQTVFCSFSAASGAAVLDDFAARVVAKVLTFFTFLSSCNGDTALRLILKLVIRTLRALFVLAKSSNGVTASSSSASEATSSSLLIFEDWRRAILVLTYVFAMMVSRYGLGTRSLTVKLGAEALSACLL